MAPPTVPGLAARQPRPAKPFCRPTATSLNGAGAAEARYGKAADVGAGRQWGKQGQRGVERGRRCRSIACQSMNPAHRSRPARAGALYVQRRRRQWQPQRWPSWRWPGPGLRPRGQLQLWLPLPQQCSAHEARQAPPAGASTGGNPPRQRERSSIRLANSLRRRDANDARPRQRVGESRSRRGASSPPCRWL